MRELGAGAEGRPSVRSYSNGGNVVMLPYRERRRRCAVCQQHLKRTAPAWHLLCAGCFFWDRGLRYLEAAVHSIRRANGER